MDINLLEAICEVQRVKGKAALVTIIDTRGSTPRKAGSKMLVYPDGRITGTIGGGCSESEVRIKALQALDDTQSVLYRVSMLNDTAAEEGMVCGGIMDVFIQVI
ncbi:MAG TPA: xanthine dehydrogenase [Sporomusaceae bacterium]|nr:xanthine dehydrogenase [Sporomusaceae bacterium]